MTAADEGRVAIHEAAHGVVAIELGLPLAFVTVARNPRCQLFEPEDDTAQGAPWTKLLQLAHAGAAAERYFFGSARLHAGDNDVVGGLLHCFSNATDAPAMQKAAETLAAAIVVTHARWIEAVAQRLQARRLLTVSEIKGLRPTRYT